MTTITKTISPCKLKLAFGTKRILGLAGNKNSGKTNNLVHLVEDYHHHHPSVPIYTYGLPSSVQSHLSSFGVIEINSLLHLINKRDCLLILDEFQRLHLNDRRYRDTLNEFVDFVYHNNVYVILSTPNLREFNSVIGSSIERWLLKDLRIDQCVNGSQLKHAVGSYCGRYKCLGNISLPCSSILVLNDDFDLLLDCLYVPVADTKAFQKSLF